MYLSQNNPNKPKLPRSPWDSPDFQRICREYKAYATDGTMREYKEEYKTLIALDYFDYIYRIGTGGTPFELTDTLLNWLLGNRVFRITENYIRCFFGRRQMMPASEHPRCHRKFPSLTRNRTKKKYNKRIYRDAVHELKKIQGTARQYNREADFAHIQEIHLSLHVIYNMVRIYYVTPMSACKLQPKLYSDLVAVAPDAAGMYTKSPDGRYVTKQRSPFGRVLGAGAAELMLKAHLESFSKHWPSR